MNNARCNDLAGRDARSFDLEKTQTTKRHRSFPDGLFWASLLAHVGPRSIDLGSNLARWGSRAMDQGLPSGRRLASDQLIWEKIQSQID